VHADLIPHETVAVMRIPQYQTVLAAATQQCLQEGIRKETYRHNTCLSVYPRLGIWRTDGSL
jgi:hypothetical protein